MRDLFRLALIAPLLGAAPQTERADQLAKLTPEYQTAHGCGAALGRSQPSSAERSMPLLDGLAPVHWKVDTASTEAQRYFDQGLALTYGFEYVEAERSFRAARSSDPNCLMCAWGVAYAKGPNINSSPIQPDVLAAAREITTELMAKRAALPERDRLLIEALHDRYAPGGSTSTHGVHGARFAGALLNAAVRFPDDDVTMVLAAEAAMTAQPWDYWERGGRTPKPWAARAIPLIEKVLARSPDQAQAIHLYIHLTEGSANPGWAEAAADRLQSIAPRSAHLVHMPSHTFYGVGRHKDAIEANRTANTLDEAYSAAVGKKPLWFRHHAHFMVSAAEQIGDRDTALRLAHQLESSIPVDEARKSTWLQEILSTALAARAQFASPVELLASPAPDARLSRLRAMWHGLRAEAYGMLAKPRAMEAELRALNRLRARVSLEPPVTKVADLAELMARGRLAYAEGRFEQAAEHYRGAAAIEAEFDYSEPPLWHQPVNSALGAALLRTGEAREARAAFKAALASRPGNGWATWGLMLAQQRTRDLRAAKETEARLRRTWMGSADMLRLERL